MVWGLFIIGIDLYIYPSSPEDFAVLKLSKIIDHFVYMRVLLCFVYNILFRKAGKCHKNISIKIRVLMLEKVCFLVSYSPYL